MQFMPSQTTSNSSSTDSLEPLASAPRPGLLRPGPLESLCEMVGPNLMKIFWYIMWPTAAIQIIAFFFPRLEIWAEFAVYLAFANAFAFMAVARLSSYLEYRRLHRLMNALIGDVSGYLNTIKTQLPQTDGPRPSDERDPLEDFLSKPQ